jgi:outer membrane receptor protein involved in Fe transport
VGGDYLTEHYLLNSADGGTSFRGDAAPNPQVDGEAFSVWAAFGQLNIPVIGEANALPLIQSLEFEISGRIDGYSNVGTTKNPKFAVNWNVGEGLLLRASMGTSFRAPTFAEVSPITNVQVNAINVAGGASGNTEPTCAVIGQPAPAGTAAAVLNPTCSAGKQFPGGISLQGGSETGTEVFGARHPLQPESARNWTVGFDFSPTDFLPGLNINSSYYNIKINGIIQSLNRGNGLSDPVPFNEGFWILPTDPNFATYVANAVKIPGSDPKLIPSGIQFIEDRTKTNLGWRAYEGFDFATSYVWDLGDFGAWNTGITGDYVINRRAFDGVQIVEDYKGKDSGGRLNYRARLGWAGGPEGAFSATLFMNWQAHYGNQEAGDNIRAEILPPTCFQIGNPACNASGLPQFAQYASQYALLTNYEPARVTFDITLGYKTGDTPANDYLKNIGVQLVVNNFLNKKPNFAYQVAFSGGSPRAFDDHQDPSQRVVTLILTKAW